MVSCMTLKEKKKERKKSKSKKLGGLAEVILKRQDQMGTIQRPGSQVTRTYCRPATTCSPQEGVHHAILEGSGSCHQPSHQRTKTAGAPAWEVQMVLRGSGSTLGSLSAHCWKLPTTGTWHLQGLAATRRTPDR